MSGAGPTRELGTVGLSVWAARYAARRRGALAAVLSTLAVKAGLDVLKPWPLKVLVDHVLAGRGLPGWMARAASHVPGAGAREGLLGWCVAATLALFALAWAADVLAAFANLTLGQRMVYDLALDLFAHLQRLSLQFHARRSAGDLISRVTVDCGAVSTIAKDALLPLAGSAVALAAMFAVMWQINPVLTLLSLGVVPALVFTLRRYSGPMADRSYEHQEAEGRMYEAAEQALSTLPVVQAFGQEPAADARFRAATSAALRANLRATGVQLRFKVFTGLATAVGTAAILYVGATRALRGALSVGDILVFLSYLGSLYGPLESLMYTSSTIQSAAGSARRVLEVLAVTGDVADRPGAADLGGGGRVAGHVRFEGVAFGYEPGRPVLRDASLDVRPGETLAIVGATGAGKSTLVGLVPRFFDPWAGRVTVDGADVRGVTLASLRRNVSVVLQDPLLFPTTVAENIAYGRPGASRADVEAAAAAARAHDFITRLPDGYDTVVGERGATLSGGERQRISIARALLKDAPVLILDEPTSALDARTEGELMTALRRLMRGRTTLVIAHRLSTVRAADRIIVLRDGAVAETGRHEELLARDGLYAKLHRLQVGEGMPPEPTVATAAAGGDGR